MKPSNILITLLIAGFIATFMPVATTFADADFFETNITQNSGKAAAHDLLADLQIRNISLKSGSEKARLAQTQFFLAQTKKETESRFQDGEITQYALCDIKNELSYLVYSMNEYFTNIRSFERSNNATYKKLALQNLDDAQMAYTRLKTVTLQTARR